MNKELLGIVGIKGLSGDGGKKMGKAKGWGARQQRLRIYEKDFWKLMNYQVHFK